MPMKLPPHEWLRETRLDKKIRQEDVEAFTAEIGPRAKISQSHLSKIERGTSPLAGLGPVRMDALRQALRLSPEEWVENTGLQIVSQVEPAQPDQVTTSTPDIPSGLLEAGEKYAAADPLIAHPKVQAMLARAGNFNGRGPVTAQEWFRYFMSVRDWIEVEE